MIVWSFQLLLLALFEMLQENTLKTSSMVPDGITGFKAMVKLFISTLSHTLIWLDQIKNVNLCEKMALCIESTGHTVNWHHRISLLRVPPT